MNRKAHFFQHVPFENLGEIETWLIQNKYQIDSTQFFKTWDEPNIDKIDFLIVMGGSMSVYDFKEYPWLKKEISLIKSAIKKGIPLLGICLGAQLIASALETAVYKNKNKEIGWFKVETVESHKITAKLPNHFQAFHWHGDTFNLPSNSIQLFRTEACENQGFLYGDKVLGLQFHLESNKKTVSKLVNNCKDELTQEQFIQSEPEIHKLTKKYCKESNTHLFNLLDSFVCF